MTVVATPPSFANINRPAWGSGSNGPINHDEVRGMFAPRKTMQRTNSSSSIASNSSTSSTSSTSTLVSSNGSINGGPVGGGTATPVGDSNGFPITTLRKRPPQKSSWSTNRPAEGPSDFVRGGGGGQMPTAGLNGASAMHQMAPYASGQMPNGANGLMARSAGESAPPQSQPVLYLISLNGTFDRKTITVPYHPETLRIGRQTNKTTTPTTVNGFFDSKVLSRQHAEIWADRQSGKIWIRDIKSSNGTFVNGTRLSAENRESDPHELQTNDQLELGIDIVSEDQKSVVHHKVSARVEHAGFISPSSNLLDMNYGDLDPANNSMLGPQINGIPYYGRPGNQSSQGTAGRMAPSTNMAVQANGAALSRNLWLTGPSTEAIVKKIHQEMRNAKQQSNDLIRTQEFLKTLLSKDDLRNDPKRDEANGSRSSLMVNGNGLPFRTDAKARFSDPPAPPPQQPLPEKPDVPSLKRGSTERPKSGSYPNSSPAKQDAVGQMNQLSDALKTAKLEIDTQHSRVRELEDKLQKEQEARKSAEELARRLEEMTSARHMNGSASGLAGQGAMLEGAFEPPTAESAAAAESKAVTGLTAESGQTARELQALTNGGLAGDSVILRSHVESMVMEMEGMRKQLEEFRKRAEKAEAERDADRETLAQMVMRIRERDEQDAKLAAASGITGSTVATQSTQTISRSLSRGRQAYSIGLFNLSSVADADKKAASSAADGSKHGAEVKALVAKSQTESQKQGEKTAEERPTLSRMNTITPTSSSLTKTSREQAVAQAIPYASMVGVVLLGVGLMAYINGWKPQAPRLDC
ncbi:cytoplasm to vacuole targeting protein [Grosmannia clavigera kw1407]|uniref:Cytoplasm to vacuole targeting protein n=1 Tax=Grosmannia clavigera (strain kw1407 / UAMH 11150) TaxID=655863 RepID=F0XK67_GROCL|nr:cytoplasm to vacuole targeting protein [Grosmannia clavigera kw1407]EFX01927.1 cytoplasm to vacuole targeting protein [Grosmannia clavigera kw1407]